MKIMSFSKLKSKRLLAVKLITIVSISVLIFNCKNDRDVLSNDAKPRLVLSEKNLKWDKKFDFNYDSNFLQQIVIDKNDNIYICDDITIKKIDSEGNVDKTWGDNYNPTKISYIYIDNSGDFYIDTWGDSQGNKFKNDKLLIYEPEFNGDISGYDKEILIETNNIGVSTITVKEDRLFIAGLQFRRDSKTKSDWWVTKYDTNGKEDRDNWNKIIDGNRSYDSIIKLVIDKNNNLYIIGSGHNLVSKNSGEDWWIKKFDTNGKEDIVRWNKKIDAFGYDDVPVDAAFDSEGNLYVVGTAVGFSQSKEKVKAGLIPSILTDWWIKKFSPDGKEDTKNWNKTVYTEFNDDRVGAIVIDKDDNVYLGGSGHFTNSGGNDWWLKKFDSEGREDLKNWNIAFDLGSDNDHIMAMAIDSQGYIYVGGYGTNLVGEDTQEDWCIKKFSPDGVEQ